MFFQEDESVGQKNDFLGFCPTSLSSTHLYRVTCNVLKYRRHRRLGWAHSLGNVTIRAKYNKSYDLQITTLQVNEKGEKDASLCRVLVSSLCFVPLSLFRPCVFRALSAVVLKLRSSGSDVGAPHSRRMIMTSSRDLKISRSRREERERYVVRATDFRAFELYNQEFPELYGRLTA